MLIFNILLACIYAQFSYSIKAGWSWPDIHNETLPGHNMILA